MVFKTALCVSRGTIWRKKTCKKIVFFRSFGSFFGLWRKKLTGSTKTAFRVCCETFWTQMFSVKGMNILFFSCLHPKKLSDFKRKVVCRLSKQHFTCGEEHFEKRRFLWNLSKDILSFGTRNLLTAKDVRQGCQNCFQRVLGRFWQHTINLGSTIAFKSFWTIIDTFWDFSPIIFLVCCQIFILLFWWNDLRNNFCCKFFF